MTGDHSRAGETIFFTGERAKNPFNSCHLIARGSNPSVDDNVLQKMLGLAVERPSGEPRKSDFFDCQIAKRPVLSSAWSTCQIVIPAHWRAAENVTGETFRQIISTT